MFHIVTYYVTVLHVTSNYAATAEAKAAYLVTGIHRFSYRENLPLDVFLFQQSALNKQIIAILYSLGAHTEMKKKRG
jgi:exonuclease V gamma subunit